MGSVAGLAATVVVAGMVTGKAVVGVEIELVAAAAAAAATATATVV